MKPHDILLATIRSKHWGMSASAFERIVSFASGDAPLSSADLTLFHQSAESAQAAASKLFGAPVVNTRYSSVQGDVGFLFASGPIIPRADMISDISGMTAIDRLTVEFKAMEADPTIRVIGLIADSPGGDIQGVEDFAYSIYNSSKPVHVFGWMMASAMYWISAAAKSVSMPASGLAGSIGVIMTLYKSKADDSTMEIISTQSPRKNLPAHTDEGRAERQKIVDALADVMIGNIAQFRGVSPQAVLENFGQGGVFVGSAAADAGLVDYIQTADEFFAAIRTDGFRNGPFAGPERTRPMSGQTEKPLVKEVLPAPVTTAADDTVTPAGAAPVVVPVVVTTEAASDMVGRLQAIEALENRFQNSPPSVQAKVRAVINAEKYLPGATVGSVAAKLLDVAASAQADAIDAYGGGLREAAATAGALSSAAEQPAGGVDVGCDSKKVTALVDARKRAFRAKGLTVNG
jgi:capsid assembly protease